MLYSKSVILCRVSCIFYHKLAVMKMEVNYMFLQGLVSLDEKKIRQMKVFD